MGLARVSLGVSLFVALACSSSCTKPTSTKLERPAPPAEGLAAARVVFVAGDVEVTPAQGAAFPAKVGVDLVGDDRVLPAASAKVVVVLRNGHAVRLDDTGALVVKDILLFSAPPTSRDVAEQLTALLDVDEKLPLDEVRDRAAAWRQMLRAGESAGAEAKLRAPTAGAASESVASTEVAAAPPAAVEPAAVEPAAIEPAVEKAIVERELDRANEAVARKKSARDDAVRADARGGKEKSGKRDVEESKSLQGAKLETVTGGDSLGGLRGVDVQVAPPPPPPEAPPVPDSPRAIHAPLAQAPALVGRFGPTVATATSFPLPASVASVVESLGVCIASGSPGLSVAAVELLLEVRGGSVVRMRLSGALPVPACARALVPQKLDVGDGWLVVPVPLGR